MIESKDYGEENRRNLRIVIGFARSNTEFQRSIQQILTRYDITLSQFGVMESLYHLGDMKICEIIEKTLSTSGNMTVVIRNLEKDFFVIRKESPRDKRARLICLTEKGRDIIKEIFPENLKNLSKQLSRLTEVDKDDLSRLIKKMNGV